MKPITKAAFARRRGVSAPLVSKWIKAGLPVVNDGRIDVKAAEAWLRDYTLNSKPEKASGVETFGEARARKESALASLRQLELEERRGKLLDLEECRQSWSTLILDARAKFLILPEEIGDRLASMSDPIAVRLLLEKKIHAALEDLGKWPAKS